MLLRSQISPPLGLKTVKALQTFVPVHVPAWQVSLCVQALPSLQLVPLVAFGFEHTPVVVLQVPATWHWSSAGQSTGVPPVQLPAWQRYP